MNAKKRDHDVQRFENGWHLVTAGNWQVSVASDGVISLPRHLDPGDVEDFLTALSAAATVAHSVRSENLEAAKNDDRSPTSRRLRMSDRGAAPGAVKINPVPRGGGQRTAAAIGRRQPGPQPAGSLGVPRGGMGVPRPPQTAR